MVSDILASIESYHLRRSWQASAARLTGLATQYREQAVVSDILASIEAYHLRQSWQASSDRLTGLAEMYAGE